MNELATQSANGTNSNTDRKAIQDEIDQLTTEIDRVSETTKFNETYLLKGDGAEKAHKVNAHDAGLDGVTLTDKGDIVDVTLKELKAGDKVSIAGKNYTIGSSATDIQNKITAGTNTAKKSYTVNGKTYQVSDTEVFDSTGNNKLKKSDLTGNAGDTADATLDDLKALVTDGSTVTIGTKTYTAMTDAAGAADGIDDNDSTVITAGKAYQLQLSLIHI